MDHEHATHGRAERAAEHLTKHLRPVPGTALSCSIGGAGDPNPPALIRWGSPLHEDGAPAAAGAPDAGDSSCAPITGTRITPARRVALGHGILRAHPVAAVSAETTHHVMRASRMLSRMQRQMGAPA